MVLREGKKYPIPVSQLVIGDIVDIKFGDRVPADVRVIRSASLKVWTQLTSPPPPHPGSHPSLHFLI